MPRLSPQLNAALGATTTQPLSYNGVAIQWDENAPVASVANTPILGRLATWLNDWTLIFESSPSGSARLYTYDTRTGAAVQVSSSGADRLYAGGDVWAAWSAGSGYRDSLGRTHTDYNVAGVDDDGTVLVILDSTTNTGVGYLSPDDATAADVTIISYDILEAGISIRNGVIVYRANGVLTRYTISTGGFSTTNVPVVLYQNDGNWVVGRHLHGLELVVFEFGRVYCHRVSALTTNFNADIRVADDGVITIVSASNDTEPANSLRQYTVNQTEPFVYLFSDKNQPTLLAPGTGPLSVGETVVGSDIITVGRNPAGSEQGFAQLVTSTAWYGASGGRDIRAAWQYGVTAVAAATTNTTSEEVTVKNSNGDTYSSGRTAYGSTPIAIRPAPTTSEVTPLWELTWVANATTYSRVTLDENLANTVAIANTTLTFNTNGLLDLYANGDPIATTSHETEWYGYVKIRWATTRGDWTIGQDASPTCSIDRLVAWNSVTRKAYVVWNGTTTVPSRLALDYDAAGVALPVVTPGNHTFAIRFDQFLPLTQIALQTGETPGHNTEPVVLPFIGTPNADYTALTQTLPSPTLINIPSISYTPAVVPVTSKDTATATAASLQKDTRVFRKPQTIPPTKSVLAAIPAAGGADPAAIAATIFGSGSGGSMDENPPTYNPQYPYNTVLIESEAGHLIEVDDTPNAERVHIYHRAGSHIEMCPDGGVKYKATKNRQDMTMGNHDIRISGDCNIVVDGGHTIHIRNGEFIIEAAGDAAINVKGQLKIAATAIEMKAAESIFLNSPKVDIGGIAPGGQPMMSLPGGVTVNELWPSDITLVPKVNLPISATGLAKLKASLTVPDTRFVTALAKNAAFSDSSKAAKALPGGSIDAITAAKTTATAAALAAQAAVTASVIEAAKQQVTKVSAATMAAAVAKALKEDAVDPTGEPIVPKLAEQPGELPLSNPKLYRSETVIAADNEGTTAQAYVKLRGRTFDTPEDVSDTESYSAHINLCAELGDITQQSKASPGTVLFSDETIPEKEPIPVFAFSLPVAAMVTCTDNSKIIVGRNTTFTEDLDIGQTITVNDTTGVIAAIASDTELVLTDPWPSGNQTGELKVYRLRPMQEFFGKYTYTDDAPLGLSKLRLKDVIVNFTSPVIEVPQIKPTSLGGSEGTSSSGNTAPNGNTGGNTTPTNPTPGVGGGVDLPQPNSDPFN